MIWLCVAALEGARADYALGEQAYRRGDLMQAVSLWREAGWMEDDLLAQSRLGGIYRDGECLDDAGSQNSVCIEADPIEAYVWFYLAGANVSRLGLTLEAFEAMRNAKANGLASRDELFAPMVPNEQLEAQQRFIYVMATRGATGLFRLGELYDERRGQEVAQGPAQQRTLQQLNQFRNLFARGNAAPAEAQPATPPASSDLANAVSSGSIARNTAEALAYYRLAAEAGHPIAADLEASLRDELTSLGPSGTAIIQSADRRADTWRLPIDFYPPPYSDESGQSADRVRAIGRIGEIEVRYIQLALQALGYYAGPIDNDKGPMTSEAIKLYQGALGAERTGTLRPEQTVRLIQTAAAGGNALSQYTLGTMYYKGVGEPQNYIRARYWFERAAEQNEPYSLNALGILYRDGRGVAADPNLSAAYFRRARDAGFR